MIIIKNLHKDGKPGDQLLIPGSLQSVAMSTSVSTNAKKANFPQLKLGSKVGDVSAPLHSKIEMPRYSISIHLQQIFGQDIKSILSSLSKTRISSSHTGTTQTATANYDSTFVFEPVAVFLGYCDNTEDVVIPQSYTSSFLTAGYIESFTYESASAINTEASGILNLVVVDCRMHSDYAGAVEWSKAKDSIQVSLSQGNPSEKPKTFKEI